MAEHDHAAEGVRERPAGVRVLVLDPDLTHRLLTVRLLQRLGATADSAGSTAEAFELADRNEYGLALVDLDLVATSSDGRPDGLLSAEPRLASVLVAMGFPGAEDSHPPPGFALSVTKPVSSDDLRLALATVRRPAADTAGAEPAVDRETLTRLAEDLGDAAIVADTVGLYLAELPERLQALEVGMANRDAQAVRSTAHSLKSASAMLGARPLSLSCLAVERAAAEGRLDHERLRQVVAEAETVAEALRAQLAAGITT